MKQRDIEQAVSTTQTAEAEKITGVADDAVSLGKFKDVKSLLTAYENLESEFTRRSRRLKELEGIVSERKGETTPTGASPETVATDGGTAKNPIVAEATAEKAISDEANGEGKADKVNPTPNADKNEKTENDESGEKSSAGAGDKNAEIMARLLSLEKSVAEFLNKKSAENAENAEIAGNAKSAVSEEAAEKTTGGEGVRGEYDAEEIVKAYLLNVMRGKTTVPAGGGAAIVAPPHKPKSFAEAGKLAAASIKNHGG